MPMPLENLATLLRKHPTAKIGEIDHKNQSIFFSENGHQKVMIFMGTDVVGVWWNVHTRADWSKITRF